MMIPMHLNKEPVHRLKKNDDEDSEEDEIGEDYENGEEGED